MILVRAPFRIPIGGGGTDLPSYYSEYGGYLITGAINKYMYITINIAASVRKIKISYSKIELVDDINEIKHDIVRETLKHLNFNQKIEIGSMADAAAGTGLGSSSAYTVCLLKGMNAYLHRFINKDELAEEACLIEIEKAKRPIGKQDQYASALGGIFSMDISKSGQVKTKRLNLDNEIIKELEYRLLMFYTDISRDANDILGEQSSNAKNNDKNVIESMHTIKEIGKNIEKELERGDIDNFGSLLHEHWLTKKKISSKMSNNQIDGWYELAMKNGALGGKIMGAGGGGFLLFCVKSENRKNIIRLLESAGLHYMDMRFDFDGAKVLFNV
jgi:D-glycero-alpha-D-manno-heptose-7-phosphate kinase